MSQTIYFLVWTKKYPLIITDTKDEEVIIIKCEIANINQRYARADLPYLLKDLPEMISESITEKKEKSLLIRLSWKDRKLIEEKAQKKWYKNLSSYARDKLLEKA